MKRLLMVFICTASAFFANAQTLEENPKLNLNFETVADSSYAPAEWRKFGSAYTILGRQLTIVQISGDLSD